MKEPETYEHVPPETVGNRRQVLVSDQAGKSNLLAELQRIGLAVAKDDPRLDALLREVKEREAQGYAYDGADASFELLARRALRVTCRIISTCCPSASSWRSATRRWSQRRWSR